MQRRHPLTPTPTSRSAPTFLWLPGTPQRATRDHVRHGTIDLFAALDMAAGTVITELRSNHTADDFVRFLNKINREVPDDLDVHLMLDNLSTHKSPKVHRWLLRHRRFHLHFTPTHSSWLNMVERWFAALTTKKLQRSSHRSVTELATDITDWISCAERVVRMAQDKSLLARRRFEGDAGSIGD